MPNVEGHSLRDRLRAERQLPVDEAVRITMEVAGALDHAHRHGVIHRDVKPENIMLQDGHALVADFGIGKAVGDAAPDTLTQSGMSVGTPAYMSPEQAVGETVDGRSDIYSLGCVLYEMIVGEQPFTGPTAQAVIAKRFVQTPLDVAALREGVPRPVARPVQKALARIPIDRYDTAAHFVTSLGEVEAVSVRPAAPEKSLAVLPFTNLSTDPENEFFADGITEEILNALATIPELRVAGRASSFSFKGKAQELRAIGEQLNVRTVLEGSVRRSGQRVRITAQLSDVTDGFRMWSERYDREIADVFAVQDEIAAAIAEKFKTALQQDRAAAAQDARVAKSSGSDCAALATTVFTDVRITQAAAVAPAVEPRAPIRVAHCKVSGVIGKETRFELLLPDDWNQRFFMGGAGGFAGEVVNMAQSSVNSGYATVGTDAGHQANRLTAGWALNQPERLADYGYLAVHRTAEVARQIIRAYYGSAPVKSYFFGCSNGGREALMEAQRFPADFDGIVAVAPAADFVAIAAAHVRNLQAQYPTADFTHAAITPANLQLLQSSVLAACNARDGVRDSILDAMAATGNHAPTLQGAFATESFKYIFTADSTWDYTKYDLSHWAADTKRAAGILSATNADLSAFRAHGGKLILAHGWSDPALNPL